MGKTHLFYLILFVWIYGCYSTEIISSSGIDSGIDLKDCIRYPVAYIPSDREVIPGQRVNLRVLVHPLVCTDEIAGVEWSQISGPTIYLTNNSSENTSFIVPPEYEDILLRVKIKGRENDYEDTLLLKVVDKCEGVAPFADADGDIKIPAGYSHKVLGNYSQGRNRSNLKYLWLTLPESNPLLIVDDNEKMEATITLKEESAVPQILLLEVIENGLRSTRNIKLIYTNTESQSVIISPRFHAVQSEIFANVNSEVELTIKDIENYDPDDIFWYQLGGDYVEITKKGKSAIIYTSEYVDELVFAAFVRIDKLFSPPVFFKIISGKNLGMDPPVANAGSDQKVKALSEVRLNGSKSTVSYPRKIMYRWKQVYGPSVQLKNDDTAFPSFTAPRILGKLIFLLTVSDGYVTSRPDTVVIEVSN